MDRFVEECRKEWNRLGVAQAVANEMAADLEADLAEAQADGVPPEAVLGNGLFDAQSFAASWATECGVVPGREPSTGRTRSPGWAIVASGLLSFLVALVGLALLSGRRASAVSIRHAVGPFAVPRAVFVGPYLPGPLTFIHGPGLLIIGFVLLLAGLAGLALTLWLWKPWSSHRTRGGFDDSVGLPSYL